MKLVLDTNVLFSFFWKGSLIRKLLFVEHDLFSPKFALDELNNNKLLICKKTKLSAKEFDEFVERLQRVVEFVHFSRYSNSIPEAFSISPENPKDIDFLALALELEASILSRDRRLKEQSRIRIFDESEFSKLL